MRKRITPIGAEETFARCERLWPGSDARAKVLREFQQAYDGLQAKIMVLDDDPTGVQTVHDLWVTTVWDEDTLLEMLKSEEREFFVLTNSRSFSQAKTTRTHQEIARNAVCAARKAGVSLIVISRGDSTLRGHYPLETRVLRQTLEAEGMPAFAGEVFCPFFQEGGRVTLNGVHYVRTEGLLVPAGQTEFAKDPSFGYRHSFLPAYLQEKSGGTILPEQIVQVTLEELRSLDFAAIEQKLLAASGFHYVVVDALEEADVRALAIVLIRLQRRGRPYMIRSAAAVPKIMGNLTDRPLLRREEMINASDAAGGLVVVGSYVQKTTQQLERLQASDLPLTMIEFRLDAWRQPDAMGRECRRAADLAERAMRDGKTAVVYTSRRPLQASGALPEEQLNASAAISDALANVVRMLPLRPRFLIAKGGITSSDIGTKALNVQRARVLGQAKPGIPVWKTGRESLFPGMAYIIFPGNVGDAGTLREIVEMLS